MGVGVEYLIVGSSESSSNIFVVEHLYLECKEFFKLNGEG